jgi:hypothetical protein
MSNDAAQIETRNSQDEEAQHGQTQPTGPQPDDFRFLITTLYQPVLEAA